jgi:hypothetical protein
MLPVCLNQRVPGSSPGTSTTQSTKTKTLEPASEKGAFAAISRDFLQPPFGLCGQIACVSGAKNPVQAAADHRVASGVVLAILIAPPAAAARAVTLPRPPDPNSATCPLVPFVRIGVPMQIAEQSRRDRRSVMDRALSLGNVTARVSV